HEQLKMPPAGKLDSESIDHLTTWIANGAFWPESPAELFTAKVHPVFKTSCFACHLDSQQGGLRMDSREALLKGGKSGPAIVPGEPEKSLLIETVRYSHERLKMPPVKKLPEDQIENLVKWVKLGAVWPDATSAAAPDEYKITPEQRAFWAFQLVKDPPVPAVQKKDWARNAIDHFILARLEKEKLMPAETAGKRTLIRRASYDLTGLPPTPEEVKAFLADESPDAFEKVVDRLLASPHYGERWGRHWLDLVRYADTAGDSADYPVPQAFRYRDYVIDSFNADKPYDQFIREQIAGDLLPAGSEEERWEKIVATGYIASSRRFSVRPERNMHLTIDDTIDNLGKTFLGLTVACARCHDHKYDPISSKDYYALYGIFQSTRYPFAGSENDQFQKDLVLRMPQQKADAILKPYMEKLAPIEERLKTLEEERKQFRFKEDKGDRTVEQINAEIKAAKAERMPIAMTVPLLEKAYAVSEGKPENARVFKRGDPKTPGDEVSRRFLQILGGQQAPADSDGSGRLQLAEWIADQENPLTARVMVNRIWQHHFGAGIVGTPSDFGKRSEPPAHPELLDYLAARFIESGWSIKAMHRLMMLSRAYQLSSDGPAANLEADPGNKFLWKFNRRRLSAEEIRDSFLLLSGEIETRRSGPHPFPHQAQWSFTQHKPFAAVYESNSRSVYLMTQRIQRHPYLSIFDGADNNVSTAERLITTTPIQALYMMNSQFVHERTQAYAEKLTRAFPDVRERLQRAHWDALSRPLSAEEMSKAENYLEKAHTELASLEKPDMPAYRYQYIALASYLRALLSSNEFIYVD
ncbi:MAG: PSD1 and planctomycete cytochrome C domain-containing protein, partial [Bryobacteraceae bacterium]